MIDVLAPEDTLTTDGCTLRTRRWSAPDPRAVVVLVHGFAASAVQPSLVRQAEALAEEGLEVFSYDSRGHGRSGGLCTLGDAEEHDVAAAVDMVRSLGLPVVLVGASMGAIAVLRYAAAGDGAVVGVVSVSSPAAWRAPLTPQGILTMGLTRTRLGRLIADRYMKVRLSPAWTAPTPPRDLVALMDVPVAVVHGEADRFIKPSEAVEIYRNCREPRRLDLVPSMGHAYEEAGVPAITAAVEWVLDSADLAPVLGGGLHAAQAAGGA